MRENVSNADVSNLFGPESQGVVTWMHRNPFPYRVFEIDLDARLEEPGCPTSAATSRIEQLHFLYLSVRKLTLLLND
jgi:hypothetical protein